MKHWDDARRAFRKALEIDGDSAAAHDGLAGALLRLGKPTAAAEHALIAVGLLHHFPGAHHRLGVALTRLRMHERAIEAFETALKIAPMSVAPHRWLERIYRQRLDRPELAAEHLNKIEFIRKTRKQRADKAKA
jgi:tetratricopeptide (TPR) repeat protein